MPRAGSATCCSFLQTLLQCGRPLPPVLTRPTVLAWGRWRARPLPGKQCVPPALLSAQTLALLL